MKIFSTFLVLIILVVYGVAARETAVPATSLELEEQSNALMPMANRGGWVNPEDLDPMPQCIAQQDQSLWLDAMTKCTSSRCTNHFTFICTHKQWLTQLSCLHSAFSPDLVKHYLPQCSQSVLAKIQLKLWIERYTARTWLVDVGDANNLLPISPAFLRDGYTTVGVLHHAPTCLLRSASASSMENFEHIIDSCSFTTFADQIGNIQRPWEYNKSLRSMVALGYKTLGLYTLTGRGSFGGMLNHEYFEKQCFCSAYGLRQEDEPCSTSPNIDLMRERLWMNATCGPAHLWENWEDVLKTTGSTFIPVSNWHWPRWTADVPQSLTELNRKCSIDACEVNSGGYCNIVVRSVDRPCFCQATNYESCGDQCQKFEDRIAYVNWLHDLCGDVQDWHGLPDDWRELAKRTTLDLIPWKWTLEPFSNFSPDSTTHGTPARPGSTCASTELKLGIFALSNTATVLVAIFTPSTRISWGKADHLRHLRPWYCTGVLMATLQVFANEINGLFVQSTFGYEQIPVAQLVLLWSTMPRMTSLISLMVGVGSFKELTFSAVASPLLTEAILQGLSSHYMFMTINYGWEHTFYQGFMERLEGSQSAQLMYAGAYLWRAVLVVTVLVLLGMLSRYWGWLTGTEKHHWSCKGTSSEEASLMSNHHGKYTPYGATISEYEYDPLPKKALTELYIISIISMLLLWAFQWLFWIGYIGVAIDKFCPPNLLTLAVVWTVFSWAGVLVGAA